MFKKKIDSNYLHSVKWGGAAIGTSFLRLMLLVPAFLGTVGNDAYALWLVLLNTASLITALSTGFLHYSSNLLNITYHTSSTIKPLVANIVKTAMWVTLLQAIIGAVIALPSLLSFFVRFDVAYLSANNASVCLLLLLATRLMYQYTSSFLLRLFEPLGGVRQTLKYQFFSDLSDLAATGIAILLSGSILVTCLSVFVTNLLVFMLSLWYVKRNVHFYNFSFADADMSSFFLIKKSGMLNAGFLIEKFYDNGINLVVQAFFGANGTTLFNTCRSMSNVFYRLTYSIMLPFFPSIQKQYALGNFSQIATIARRYWSVSTVIIMAGLLCGLPLLPVFYHYWTKGELVFNASLIVLLFVGVLFQNFVFLISEFFKKTNMSKQLITFNIIKALITVLSIWLFSVPGYSWGIGAGIALAEIFGTAYALFVFTKNVFAIRGIHVYFIQTFVFSLLLLTYAITGNYTLLVLPGVLLIVLVLYRNRLNAINDLG